MSLLLGGSNIDCYSYVLLSWHKCYAMLHECMHTLRIAALRQAC
jgi:hypothetical protein